MNLPAALQKISGFIRQKPVDAILMLSMVIIVSILFSLYFSVNDDDGQWNQFKAEHNCKLQTNESGTQRSSWLCDDGKTYYRWIMWN